MTSSTTPDQQPDFRPSSLTRLVALAFILWMDYWNLLGFAGEKSQLWVSIVARAATAARIPSAKGRLPRLSRTRIASR